MHALPDSRALDASGAPDALVSLDVRCRVVGVNAEFARLLGVDASAVVGADFRTLVCPREPEGSPWGGWPASARLASVRAMPAVELDVTHAGGRTLKTLAAAKYVRSEGVLAGAVLSLRDIGQRRLESVAAQAVATVSHEVRAPLTGVRGFASLLLRRGDDLDPAQRRELLEQIVADAERMSRLVADLLDMSRLEAGRVTYRIEPVDLAAACSTAAGGLDVSVTVAPETIVEADRDKLIRILTNLVENAVAHGEAPVTVAAGTDGETVTVVVADTGTIPPEVLGRVFAKFWHRDASAGANGAGSGLGLYIARELATGMGAALAVSSDPEAGTRFTLGLPKALGAPW